MQFRNNIKRPSKKKATSKFFDKYMNNFPQNYLFTVSEPKKVNAIKVDIIHMLMKDIAKGTVNFEKTSSFFTRGFVQMMYDTVLEEYNNRIMYSKVFEFYSMNNPVKDLRVEREMDTLIRSRAVYDVLYRDIEMFYLSSETGRPDFSILMNIPNKIKYSEAYLV